MNLISKLLNSIQGRSFVVVGAAGNLGPAWCRAILENEGLVIGVGLNIGDDAKLQSLLSEYPSHFNVTEGDITEGLPGALTDLLAEKRIDGVVMNAGVDSVPGSGRTSIVEYSLDEWARVLTVNVAGVVNYMNQLIPHLSAKSSIVLLGSIYGLVSPRPSLYSHYNEGLGAVKNPAYGASKAALIAVCKQYATHLAHQGVRVNLLTPGGVLGSQDSTFKSKFIDHVPLGRMVTEDELVASLLFLLSEESSYITGHNLIVDGGYLEW